MGAKLLCTGGCGFIGHHIIEHVLKNTDWNVVCIDRLDYASEGYDRLRDIKVFDDKRVQIFSHDIGYPLTEGLKKEIGDVDYILHMAAGSHVDNSITDPVPFIQNNVNSTLYILEYARELLDPRQHSNLLKKFLYFSTDEVYGTAPEGINYIEGDRFNPGNPYSASKAASECICQAYANTYKLPIIITNTMNVLGERQHPEKYLPKIINHVLDEKTLMIHSNPQKTEAGKRHYIHARSVADGIVFIINNVNEFLDNRDSSKGRFNVVGEKEYDNLSLA